MSKSCTNPVDRNEFVRLSSTHTSVKLGGKSRARLSLRLCRKMHFSKRMQKLSTNKWARNVLLLLAFGELTTLRLFSLIFENYLFLPKLEIVLA